MAESRKRLSSEVIKRGYSEEEVANIYELARFSLENGDIRRGEIISQGLVEVAPDYVPAWLCLSCVQALQANYEMAAQTAQQALRLDPSCLEAHLFLSACQLSLGDFNSAGTHLGEVAERVESGLVDNNDLVRFYRIQLARYQNRGG